LSGYFGNLRMRRIVPWRPTTYYLVRFTRCFCNCNCSTSMRAVYKNRRRTLRLARKSGSARSNPTVSGASVPGQLLFFVTRVVDVSCCGTTTSTSRHRLARPGVALDRQAKFPAFPDRLSGEHQ
jgi:hypothetical protein